MKLCIDIDTFILAYLITVVAPARALHRPPVYVQAHVTYAKGKLNVIYDRHFIKTLRYLIKLCIDVMAQ